MGDGAWHRRWEWRVAPQMGDGAWRRRWEWRVAPQTGDGERTEGLRKGNPKEDEEGWSF